MDFEKGRVVLLELAHILDECGIPFFLIQGTALGAYRDSGFTPTEQDIDLGILAEYLKPLVMLALLECEGYEVETYREPFTRTRTVKAKKHGIRADLVGFMRWKDWRFTCSPIRPNNVNNRYALVHDAAMLENYETLTLFGREFHVPTPIEEYLRREYGDDWRTPRYDPVSRTRRPTFIDDEHIPRGLLEA